jgi:hypothetical protein
MKTLKVADNRFDAIVNAAPNGSYLRAEVSLLTPNLHPVTHPRDAHYLVIESAHIVTIIQLDKDGRPYAILERE